MSTDPILSLSKIATALNAADGLRSACSSAAEGICTLLDARVAFVISRGEDTDTANLLGSYGLGAADFRRLESRIRKSGVWRVFALGRPMVVDDLGLDPVLNFLAFGAKIRTLFTVPIFSGESVIGLLASGFDPGQSVSERSVVKLQVLVASLISQSFRLERAIRRESERVNEENIALKRKLKEKYDFSHIIGNSGPMRQVYDRVTQIARTNATVLLRGENGTGKDLIANVLHYNSLRAKRPIVKISLGALPAGLIDSELFGSQETGKKALVRTADGGTLLIEEAADLPVSSQEKLLSILRRQRYADSTGGDVGLNVRLIVGTCRDLEAAASAGLFDPALLEALRPFSVFLPPLRERKSDILLLAEHFLDKFSREQNKSILRISTPAIDMLSAYHFPGNVRELENVMQKAVELCDSNVIHGRHLPPTLQTAEESGTETRLTLASAVSSFERDLIQDTLKSTRGNITKAARMLDSTERILGYKIGKYNIDPRRYKR